MNYGKFASAEELLKGYNELEKSFTQKCQQLAVSEKEKAQFAEKLSVLGANSADGLQVLQQSAVAQTDGTSAEASPSQEVAQSTTVDSAVTVPQSNNGATVVLDGVAQTSSPTDEQLQQYLESNPQVVSKLLHKSAKAPDVMSGGGNVSMALPSRPKSIKEASLMAKELFFKN